VSTPSPTTPADFNFLDGWFEVVNRRLRDPLDPASGWDEFAATTRALVLFDGAVSVDEMWFPEQQHYGMSLRIFNPADRQWSVYWVDGRRGRLEPPVRGSWQDGECWFTGREHLAGKPIDVSYSWFDVTSAAAKWEQCFSVDGGQTWQPNWRMTWTRLDSPPTDRPSLKVTSDFDFLVGDWRVSHRRDATPLADSTDWRVFEAGQRGWTFFDGSISVDEVELDSAGHRGLTFRVYDPHAEQWSIYWVNSRVGELETPVCGTFESGVGRFESVETIGGREVHVRFVWDDISDSSARWRQSFSLDAGTTWRENWEMRLARVSDALG
jgi:hypothetical protein